MDTPIIDYYTSGEWEQSTGEYIGDDVYILPYGYGSYSASDIYGDGTDLGWEGYGGDILGIGEEAQKEMVLVGSEDQNTVSTTEGATETTTELYVQDPYTVALYERFVEFSEKQENVNIHYHNMETFSMVEIAVITMILGGIVAYGFLRRIFV